MTADHRAAIDALVRCGVDRILTSGQRDTAEAGLDILVDTMRHAAGRIGIMACGGLDATNIGAIRRAARPDEMHFSAPRTEPSRMAYTNPHVGMGGTALEREYTNTVTDEASVRAVIAAARAA